MLYTSLLCETDLCKYNASGTCYLKLRIFIEKDHTILKQDEIYIIKYYLKLLDINAGKLLTVISFGITSGQNWIMVFLVFWIMWASAWCFHVHQLSWCNCYLYNDRTNNFLTFFPSRLLVPSGCDSLRAGCEFYRKVFDFLFVYLPVFVLCICGFGGKDSRKAHGSL